MKETPTPQAPESAEPQSATAIDNWIAELCVAMQKDLKDAEEHRTNSFKALQVAKYGAYYAAKLKDEVISRASKHLPEARAFYIGCCSWETAVMQIAPCEGWREFLMLKKQVENYIKDVGLSE